MTLAANLTPLRVKINWKPDTDTTFEVVYTCKECRDRRWVVKSDGGAGVARPCSCNPNPISVDSALASAGMAPKEVFSATSPWNEIHASKPAWAAVWIDWIAAGSVGALPAAITNHVAVSGGSDAPHLLVIRGKTPGIGKSKLAGMCAVRWLRRGGTGLYWAKVCPIFDAIQKERFESSYSRTEEEMLAADLLVLDDAGRVQRRDPGSLANTFQGWLMDRYDSMKPTIVTTNVRLGQLGDEALLDRLMGALSAELSGVSYRIRQGE